MESSPYNGEYKRKRMTPEEAVGLIPRLCRDYMDIDTVVTTVSPMDATGHFSFGTNNDFITTAARCCKRLFVEVNDQMPRVSYVNEPAIIAKNDRMISVNAILEVDLLG
jgi:acyl-CoA hydrolase